MSDFDRLKGLLESNKQTIKKQGNTIKNQELNRKKFLQPLIDKQQRLIKNKDLNIKILRKKLEDEKKKKQKLKYARSITTKKDKSSGWGAYVNCMKRLNADE